MGRIRLRAPPDSIHSSPSKSSNVNSNCKRVVTNKFNDVGSKHLQPQLPFSNPPPTGVPILAEQRHPSSKSG